MRYAILALIFASLSLSGCALGLIIPPPSEGSYYQQQPDRHVYDESECVGVAINGRCHGRIIPDARYHETCYGGWVMGECVGAQF